MEEQFTLIIFTSICVEFGMIETEEGTYMDVAYDKVQEHIFYDITMETCLKYIAEYRKEGMSVYMKSSRHIYNDITPHNYRMHNYIAAKF